MLVNRDRPKHRSQKLNPFIRMYLLVQLWIKSRKGIHNYFMWIGNLHTQSIASTCLFQSALASLLSMNWTLCTWLVSNEEHAVPPPNVMFTYIDGLASVYYYKNWTLWKHHLTCRANAQPRDKNNTTSHRMKSWSIFLWTSIASSILRGMSWLLKIFFSLTPRMLKFS